MKRIKKIYYWSPHLVKIATPRAVINSAYSLRRYSDEFETSIINFFQEFNSYFEEIYLKKIKLINFYNLNFIKFLPKHGFFLSRISFFFFLIMGFFPLKNLIKKDNPDYLIIHLISSLPLLILIFFNFNTKFILRISGRPRLNFLRKFIWKIAFKKIYMVTCPTLSTMNYLISLNILKKEKLILLYDPIINVREINLKKKIAEKQNFINGISFFAAGRLTFQKNFLFLCRCFKKLTKINESLKLVIAGEGEYKKRIVKFIKKNNLRKNITLVGYVDNIYSFLQKSKYLVVTSLWEDPGFILLEAAMARVPVISSNCPTGPEELILDKVNGLLFISNNEDSFNNTLNYALQISKYEKQKILLNNLKLAKKFTIFSHYKNFKIILK
jgi:glycosyltransferase involved in cell wall biosynthesis